MMQERKITPEGEAIVINLASRSAVGML